MFEAAELGHRLSKEDYAHEEIKLRQDLVLAQWQLREAGTFPVIILVSGVDGSGKGQSINQLYTWFDPRYISTLAFSPPTEEERQRPIMWRYWRALPPKGRIGIFSGSWYSIPIAERMGKIITKNDLDKRGEDNNRFESMLVNENALVLKFWFHLSKDAQKKRLRTLEKNPDTAWRVTKESWERVKHYDEFHKISSHVLRLTNTPWAPWHIIEAGDDHYRNISLGKIINTAIKQKLAQAVTEKPSSKTALITTKTQENLIKPNLDQKDVISTLKLKQKMGRDEYKKELAQAQEKLWRLSQNDTQHRRPIVVVFEGADAAGKGGAIRRLAGALDARIFQIVPVAAPTQEERLFPYLWRFWRYLPSAGRWVIFDRSWYGRVLVERVEGFCSSKDWLRAYNEINDFEHGLVESGAVVVKFWLQISKSEQLRRFEERQKTAFKQFKITDEDWRNRDKWDDYHKAVCDMIERTSTGRAPWTLVEADNKLFARIKIFKTLIARLQE